jgi:hypothetical protein
MRIPKPWATRLSADSTLHGDIVLDEVRISA